MPEILKQYLADLNRTDVYEVLSWLEENPMLPIDDMLDIIAETDGDMGERKLIS